MKTSTLSRIFFRFSLLSILFVSMVQAHDVVTYRIEKLPSSLDEFVAEVPNYLSTPEAVVSAFIVAMMQLEQKGGQAKEEALLMMGMLLDENNLNQAQNKPSNSLMYHINRMVTSPEIARSYIQGTSPATGYQLPVFPYYLRFNYNPYSYAQEGFVKIFITSAGADSARPVKMRIIENANGTGDTIYKINELSSLFLGVKKKLR